MSDGVKVVMSGPGVRAVLNHPKVQAIIDERAARIAQAAGPGFHTRRRPQRVNRYGAQVRTSDPVGRRRQADDNVLIKAVGAGR
ncbi:hypothetical protein CWT12_12255 [Actinomyces sp. 432]|uniref:hypothetical protein n=1 Tax=Actinomyces sp. 432 TaxID=2057798 RepID=UPI00137447E4|nr:hypothetical protein [Actinomyces sp. 432]QHO91924.1 hypothetical protein CWT12_12255 [Actinomyces sp. 432]